LNDSVGFVSLENFNAGAILKTIDGGVTWVRKQVNDPQRNANLEGVGFVDERHGWVGGWGTADFSGGFTSETLNGGDNWQNANTVGRFINRFRFFGNPVNVGFASGRTVFKYSSEPVVPGPSMLVGPTQILDTNEPMECAGAIEITYTAPRSARRVQIDIWDRFGDHVRKLYEETNPHPGRHSLTWDCKSDAGSSLPPGIYIYRITIDHAAESRVVRLKAEER